MRAVLLTYALLLGACGDNIDSASHDAGPGSDASQPVDSGVDTMPDGPHQLTGCTDTTTSLIPRAPTEGLPCDLVPPGQTVTVTQ